MLPFTWGSPSSFAAVFGLLLWSSKPLTYFGIGRFFDVKMSLIVLAGINMLYFQLITFKERGASGDRDPVPPRAARLAGGLSLAIWLGVVFLRPLYRFRSRLLMTCRSASCLQAADDSKTRATAAQLCRAILFLSAVG